MDALERQHIDAGRGHLVGVVDPKENRIWLRFMLAKARLELQEAKNKRARLIRTAWNAGMTQREIGEFLGISKQRVGRILNGDERCRV